MSSSWKKQRRQDILQAANTVLLGSTIRANDRVAIKAVMSNYPAEFKTVVKMYGSDMVVGIISSFLDNGRLALESSAQLGFPETHQPSAVRDRQHNALEQAAAQSEAKALDKASRSDVAMYEGDQGGEQIDVTGYGFCFAMIIVQLMCMKRSRTDRRLFRVHFLQVAIFISLILVVHFSA